MKKIFLTSGLILCMTGPAFATGFGSNEYGTTGASVSVSDACIVDYLGVTTGSTTLHAQWNVNYHAITLDVTTADGEATGTSVNPSTIYGVFGDSSNVYTRSGTDDSDYVFTAMTSLTSNPSGKDVSLTLMPNKPSTAQSGDNVSITQPNDVARPFVGFYNSSSATLDQNENGHAVQYINGSGNPTVAGKGAAAVLNADATWYARYDCATFAPADPTLQGYTFDGWYTAAEGGTQVTNFCFNSDTTLYAHWTANTITITWDGNNADSTWTAPANNVGGTTSCNYGVDNVTLPTRPTRKGYTFGGWVVSNITPAGGGDQPAQDPNNISGNP